MTDKHIICKCNDKECGQCSFEEQLKRKEQECEELKKWLPIVARLEEQFKSHEKAKGIDYKTYAEQVFTELYQLKAENDELKKKCNIYTCGICGNKEDCNKLYKTLAEIKEIAEKEVNNRMLFADKESFCDFNKILQKISEVENES